MGGVEHDGPGLYPGAGRPTCGDGAFSSGRGLTDAEMERVERRLGRPIPDDLTLLLRYALPISPGFPDWRSGLDGNLRESLTWPEEGLLFSISHGDLWLDSWGERPIELAESLATARHAIHRAPTLIPIYSHRYLPTEPMLAGNPVLSVYGADTIIYGNDLVSYFHHEFEMPLPGWAARLRLARFPFWERTRGRGTRRIGRRANSWLLHDDALLNRGRRPYTSILLRGQFVEDDRLDLLPPSHPPEPHPIRGMWTLAPSPLVIQGQLSLGQARTASYRIGGPCEPVFMPRWATMLATQMYGSTWTTWIAPRAKSFSERPLCQARYMTAPVRATASRRPGRTPCPSRPGRCRCGR